MVSNSAARSSRSRSKAAAASLAEPTRMHDDSAESTEDLLRRHRRAPSRSLLSRIVERQRPAVEAMASSLVARLPRSVDAQDLVHAGLWGLMQAIDSYEPARCDQFSAFMRIRVRGAMLDELRHMDFLPRLFRRRVRECNEARARLRMELEREPTGTEVAAALGITEQALLRRQRVRGVVQHGGETPAREPGGRSGEAAHGAASARPPAAKEPRSGTAAG
jgi:RNA polymerase sigma factor (sigma-70 family)